MSVVQFTVSSELSPQSLTRASAFKGIFFINISLLRTAYTILIRNKSFKRNVLRQNQKAIYGFTAGR